MIHELKDEIWNKARTVDGFSPDLFRKDTCGAWIKYDKYGDRNSSFGWEIDHVFPIDKGGDDDPINLRPINWKNNVEKGNDYPDYFAAVKAEGTKNIDILFKCTVNDKLRQKLDIKYGGQ